MKHSKAILALVIVLLTVSGWLAAQDKSELYLIDAHSQADSHEVLGRIIGLMAQADVKHTILSGRRQLQSFDIADFAAQYPQQITASIRTKGGAYNENRNGYYKKLDAAVSSGRFGGIAEILLYHAQKGEKADEVVVYPDDPRVKAALKHAKRQGWPLILHIEFASLQGKEKQKFMSLLEALLKKNKKQPIALIHMGQLDAVEIERLIKSHKNIYFLTSHTNPTAIEKSEQPWTAMFEGNVLTPQWRKLLIQHPQHFILAFDNVWPEHWGELYFQQVQYWRSALNDLPRDVAHAIAHGNAERLWHLSMNK
jgi:hypothetical protein